MGPVKVNIEFNNGHRRSLTLAGNALLFFSAAAATAEIPAEPILLGDSEVISVSDTTQELPATHQTIHFATAAAASVATLADGLFLGQRLAVQCSALGAGGQALTLTSASGIVNASQSALTNLVFDAADEFAILDWNGEAWQVVNATCTETV